MPIPSYQDIMSPLLKLTADGKEHSKDEAVEHISGLFRLTEEEKQTLLPSGHQTVIGNRAGWARTYLKMAGLLEYTKRGYFKITDRGLDTLKENPPRIDIKYLEQFPEFVEFRAKHRGDLETEEGRGGLKTPEELIEEGQRSITEGLSQDLLTELKKASPMFFERLVIELLVKMGYGGSVKDAGEAIGRTGDGGIDGTIKEDKLGLDRVYIQAKRWESNPVGRPEIQSFVGALAAHKATKGIFVTTSDFTREARDYVPKISTNVVLIDGKRLAELMIEHNIGVSTSRVVEIKKIDLDYFTEE